MNRNLVHNDILREELEETYFKPDVGWPKYEVYKRAIERQTIFEIDSILYNSQGDIPYSKIIYEYMEQISECLNFEELPQIAQFIFQTKLETCMEIGLLFI